MLVISCINCLSFIIPRPPCLTLTDTLFPSTTLIRSGFDDWTGDAECALALLILLDQCPRNSFRDTARAFAGDAQARSVARGAIDRGFDIVVAPVQRQFFYMPFQHSEDLADQEFGMLLFAALEKDLPGQDRQSTRLNSSP